MDLELPPPWSKNQLRALGEALLNRRQPTTDAPDYGEVMLWHNDLASEVAAHITSTSWTTLSADTFSVTARSKTLDTLVQKLQRSTLKLDRVQDLAGVRIDADMTLTKQTNLANEIANHFGADRSTLKDIRKEPHSGYRGVHVWVVLPAGRVEIQLRTKYQSLWANVYEGLADVVGRGIRYDQPPEDPTVRQIVERMHRMSVEIAHDEELTDQFDRLLDETVLRAISASPERPDPEWIDDAIELLANTMGTTVEYRTRLEASAEQLHQLRRILDRNQPEG